jgi:serine protease Do
MGSGFIIDAGGLIVTNHHVIDGAQAITVTLHDGTQLEARVRAIDDKTDLALLEVETDRALAPVSFGDSDTTRVGDWVVAVGNPFGLGGSYTAGIISERGRDIRSGPYDDYLQIDAPINRGNSGGALFNVNGEVVGVNTAIFSPNGGNVGIGFAVPSRIARHVVAELSDNGHVARGWLGVQIQALDRAMASSLGLERSAGALIAEVQASSPAEAAGLQPGDVVLSVGDASVDHLRDLPRLVAGAPVGEVTKLTVWRRGETRTLEVTIAAQPAERAAQADASEPQSGGPGLGLALAPLDDRARRSLGLDANSRGVVIAGVEPGSPAARQRLQPGMRIEMVGQQAVHQPRDVARAVAQARDARRDAVLLLVADARGERRFVVVPIA